MPSSRKLPDDDLFTEVSLVDLWKVVEGGWRLIAGSIGATLVLAAGFLTIVPNQYEAEGLVDITNGINSITPQKVVERLEFPSFRQAVLRRLAWDPDGGRAKAFLASPPSIVKRGTDLVSVRVRGVTPEDAQTGLLATVASLAEIHEALAEPTLAGLESNLKSIRQEKGETQRLIREYDRVASLQSRLEPRDRFSESLLYLQMITARQNRLADLTRMENDLMERVRNLRENPTRLMTEPVVNGQPVYPRAGRVMLLAALGGGLLGLLGAFLRLVRAR